MDPHSRLPLLSDTATTPREPGSATSIFVGGGELGALCREKDWRATPLGDVTTWPTSLKTSVSIVLTSAFPMIVLWGTELVQIYNDAYRLLMGDKHPGGLGQPNRDCWPEVWHINEPIFARVFAGETISFREALYPLAPYGQLEDFYLTLCYSPIRDEQGQVGGVLVTIFDVTAEVRARAERDRAFAEAKAERQRLHEVFQRSPAIVATVTGPDHVFEMANPPYLRVVNHRDIVGKPVREALPEVAEQGFIELLDQVYRTGEPFVGQEVEVLLQSPDGSLEPHYFNFVYQALRNVDGEHTGILAHGVDVTDQVLARREVERKAAELERLTHALVQSNQDLDQFAYAASHDLKAPLRNITQLASWLEEDLAGQASPEVQRNLQLLHNRAQRMDALINGILNYSRAGRHSAPAMVDSGALVREALELLNLGPQEQVEVTPDMPTLEAEAVPLQQVFLNLIGNALKHTRRVRPDVVVRVGWRDAGEHYEFTISDNGPGIAPEFHTRIWGLFQKLESRDAVEGSGIGLALVKKTVERRGGQVWVESAKGEGACFHFTWPKVALLSS